MFLSDRISGLRNATMLLRMILQVIIAHLLMNEFRVHLVWFWPVWHFVEEFYSCQLPLGEKFQFAEPIWTLGKKLIKVSIHIMNKVSSKLTVIMIKVSDINQNWCSRDEWLRIKNFFALWAVKAPIKTAFIGPNALSLFPYSIWQSNKIRHNGLYEFNFGT